MPIKILRQVALVLAIGVGLTACSGGGKGGGDTTPVTLTGTFVDAAVNGLSYTATPSGLTGITDAEGHFDYEEGDTVTFMLGDIALGTVPATSLVTPRTIADAATSDDATAENIASNIARFLQTFDSDGNPDNGITIDEDVAADVTTPVNFAQTPEDFSNDAGYLALVEAEGIAPISNEQASAHADRSFMALLAGTWIHKNTEQGSNVLLTLTFFTNGTYLKGGTENDPDCGASNGNGVELGNFDYNAAAATLTITGVGIDTDGECGLDNGTVFTNVTIDGDTLNVTVAEDDEVIVVPFTKAANNGIVGSWLVDQPLAGQHLTRPIVATFFANGEYVIADAGSVEIDPTVTRGTERGNWSVNGSNVLSTTTSADTNGEAGLSHPVAGTTLTISEAGKLLVTEPGESPVSFSRLPLTPKITANDLAGAWYILDEGEDVNESSASNYVIFNKDGSYLLGTQGDDPYCASDYVSEGQPSGSYEDGANGSEAAHWRLDTGTGILSTQGLIAESNGSCGLFNKFAVFPDNRLVLNKVDANTITATIYEPEEGNTYVAVTFALKRVPSTSAAMTGVWTKDDSREAILFFADNSFFMIRSLPMGGGVMRGGYALTESTLVRTVDGANENCVDTISWTSMCYEGSAVSVPWNLTFNNNSTAFTMQQGESTVTYRKL